MWPYARDKRPTAVAGRAGEVREHADRLGLTRSVAAEHMTWRGREEVGDVELVGESLGAVIASTLEAVEACVAGVVSGARSSMDVRGAT